jgi:hypothetical protein
VFSEEEDVKSDFCEFCEEEKGGRSGVESEGGGIGVWGIV